MMEKILIDIAMNGGPSAIIVLIGFLVLNSKLNDVKRSTNENQAAILELRTGKRWKETCETTHVEIDRRLERLEATQNNRP